MPKFTAYFIQCITNLHAGSGDANYGVIDKLVQRDPVTDYPTIHASSLKGAIRQHFEEKWGRSDDRVKKIFGREARDELDSQTGTYKFLSADLIALPVRCTHNQFVLTFDQSVLNSVNAKSKMMIDKQIFNDNLSFNLNQIYLKSKEDHVYAEDYMLSFKEYAMPLKISLEGYTGFDMQYATMKNMNFKELVRRLPVIARNNIEDGTSKNLWYEEVVPHQTVFVTYIGALAERDPDFDRILTTDIIQVGANATIGYGLCKFFKIDLTAAK